MAARWPARLLLRTLRRAAHGFALAFAGCAVAHDVPSPDTDPMFDASPAKLCPDGEQQSPIDLPSAAPREDLPDLVLDYHESHVAITNTGGTVQCDYAPGSRALLDGTAYELLEFHFHAPSEHTIGGDRAPMELHLVHRDDAGQLLVVGALVEQGEHHPMLDLASWSELPASTERRVESRDSHYNVRQLVPGGPTYRYTGSLTAPPCMNDVKWIVYQRRLELAADQIAVFTSIYDGNFREPQALDGRVITFGE